MPSLLAESQALPFEMQVRLHLRRNQELTCNVSASASAKLAHFSSGHRMNLRSHDVAFILVNTGTSISFALRCATALAFVAPRALRRLFNFSGKRVAS
eukprot:2065983-Pleurochrysis_carterae.AAC.1